MKNASLQYGNDTVSIELPDSTDILSSCPAPVITNVYDAVLQSLSNPIKSEPLNQIVYGKKNAVIVVSDNTRPIPYKGKKGILLPVIDFLKCNQIDSILVLIACGTHRPMTELEIDATFGNCAKINGVEIINHISTDENILRCIGSTPRTKQVKINKYYLDAEIKILTGLVEPHFMAGFSGGRKTICPGISGLEVTYGFHSADILSSNNSDSLIIQNNPCHDESVRIANMAGTDFIVNVTLNDKKQINGIFCGELIAAHLSAINYLKKTSTVKIEKLYDIVITQAGEVGVNHYQCAKAVVEASKAVKPGGKIILLANLTDPDCIGGENYKRALFHLKKLGYKKFLKEISKPQWSFIPEQWQVQMWCKGYTKTLDPKNIIFCAPRLCDYDGHLISETNIASIVQQKLNESETDYSQRLIDYSLQTIRALSNKKPDILVLPDGPYSVPEINFS